MLALQVAPNGRYLQKSDGTPFFWIADTAWSITANTDEEVTQYIEDRRAKGFTVIQAIATGFSFAGFANNDVAQPIETYWQKLDRRIAAIDQAGMYVALCTCFRPAISGGVIITATNAQAFGEFIGARYRNYPIVWLLGGDDDPTGFVPVWRLIAKGIAIGINGVENYSNVMMTYHPFGNQSSHTLLHNEVWLKFNMVQSSHNIDSTAHYTLTAAAYAASPAKPVIDGEANYEGVTNALTPGNPKLTDRDVRKAAYWSMFAGGVGGFTYGAIEIIIFWNPGEATGSTGSHDDPWYVAMQYPGARQMGFLKSLMTSRPLNVRAPNQSAISSAIGSGGTRKQSVVASDGSYAMIYVPDGSNVTINAAVVTGTIRATWANPRVGKLVAAGTFANSGTRQMSPPWADDWVLLLDKASSNFSLSIFEQDPSVWWAVYTTTTGRLLSIGTVISITDDMTAKRYDAPIDFSAAAWDTASREFLPRVRA